MTAFDIGALLLAVGAAILDARTGRIPNVITVGGALAGLVAHATWPGGDGAAFSSIGALAGLLVFFPFFALRGLGGGDVKLMAALGAWVGWRAILGAALYAAVAGGVMAVIVALARGYLGEALGNIGRLARWWRAVGLRPEPSLTLEQSRGPRLPYALPILTGLLVSIWRG
jgi:prepilin peptidase CpaA